MVTFEEDIFLSFFYRCNIVVNKDRSIFIVFKFRQILDGFYEFQITLKSPKLKNILVFGIYSIDSS